MLSYDQIFENNQQWIKDQKASDEQFFEKLARAKDPDFLFIGCSDSKVTAEGMMGVQPGEVLVHQNIGNVVCSTDFNSLSVIEYAVTHLKVRHVVVCGHDSCGAIKAAMKSQDLGVLNPWLQNIRDVFRLHQAELHEIHDEKEKYKRLVELNVQEQCINVMKIAAVQKSYLSTGFPSIHGWVFDIQTGKLIDLDLNLREKSRAIHDIYDLGTDKK